MSRSLLVMFAGGDPWQINATLQSGRPTDIAGLGQAFHNSGQSTKESEGLRCRRAVRSCSERR
jgi:hypothetical protein